MTICFLWKQQKKSKRFHCKWCMSWKEYSIGFSKRWIGRLKNRQTDGQGHCHMPSLVGMKRRSFQDYFILHLHLTARYTAQWQLYTVYSCQGVSQSYTCNRRQTEVYFCDKHQLRFLLNMKFSNMWFPCIIYIKILPRHTEQEILGLTQAQKHDSLVQKETNTAKHHPFYIYLCWTFNIKSQHFPAKHRIAKKTSLSTQLMSTYLARWMNNRYIR